LLDIVDLVIDGKLDQTDIKWSKEKCICVVMASGGYPEEYEIGFEISGVKAIEEAVVYHAGTRLEVDKLVTAGGRVIVVSALGASYEAARNKVYAAVQKINFKDAHYRKDIGIK
jgi:phosphoribosylamine--glycine ligase